MVGNQRFGMLRSPRNVRNIRRGYDDLCLKCRCICWGNHWNKWLNMSRRAVLKKCDSRCQTLSAWLYRWNKNITLDLYIMWRRRVTNTAKWTIFKLLALSVQQSKAQMCYICYQGWQGKASYQLLKWLFIFGWLHIKHYSCNTLLTNAAVILFSQWIAQYSQLSIICLSALDVMSCWPCASPMNSDNLVSVYFNR